MAELSVAKRNAIEQLVRTAPEPVLRMLAAAFQDVGGEGAAAVREAVAREDGERRVRAAVFAPLVPMFGPRADGVEAPAFPPSVMERLWRELGARQPEAVRQAAEAVAEARYDDPPAPVYDQLCLAAARLLRDPAADIWADPRATELAACFELAPLARRGVEQLPEWTGKPTEAAATSFRLLLKDTTQIAEDGAPRILEILLAHLPDAATILRVIALIRGGADEHLLASSELADFGERLFAALERRLEAIADFRPAHGADRALAVAEDFAWCAALVEELSLTLELDQDGAWGRRVAHARDSLTRKMTALLRPCERLVDKALPLERVRIAGQMTRDEPRLSAPLDSPEVIEARATLTLFKAVHKTAQAIGCGGLRAQIAEALTTRILTYADELIATLNSGEAEDEAHVRALAELAAEFLGLARDEDAARTVRRRVAVAGPPAGSQAGA